MTGIHFHFNFIKVLCVRIFLQMIILLNMSFLNYILIEGDVLINTQYTVTWSFEVPISISNKLSPYIILSC